MNCFPCFTSSEKRAKRNAAANAGTNTKEFSPTVAPAPPSPPGPTRSPGYDPKSGEIELLFFIFRSYILYMACIVKIYRLLFRCILIFIGCLEEMKKRIL